MDVTLEQRLAAIEEKLNLIVEQLGAQIQSEEDLEVEAEIAYANTLETTEERLAYFKEVQKRKRNAKKKTN